MSDNENKDKIKEKEKIHIEKSTTTDIKLVVSKKIHDDVDAERKFLADLFNIPEYLEKEYRTNNQLIFPSKVQGETESYWASDSIIALLNAFGITEEQIKTSQYFKENTEPYYVHSHDRLRTHVRTTLGIDQNTSLQFNGTSYNYNNDSPIYYYQLLMATKGESKTTIAKEHKENVSKMLHFLRLNAIPLHYNCDWHFQGNRSCSI